MRGWNIIKISIDSAVIEIFPEVKIGWILADITENKEVFTSANIMQRKLQRRLSDIGISSETMMIHPDISRWREVFSKMKVKPSKHLSSLEKVLTLAFKGELFTNSAVVNAYNFVSAINPIPIGAVDRDRVLGDFVLRFAKTGERVSPCASNEKAVDVDVKHVVYSDDEKICRWLWNHRESSNTALSKSTKQVLFIIDTAFETEWRSVEETISSLFEELEKVGCKILESGVIDNKLSSLK